MNVSIDTSLLVHATVARQQTSAARAALTQIVAEGHRMFGAPGLHLEYPSLLRRLISQRRLAQDEGDALFGAFLASDIIPVPLSTPLQERAWELARRLGQSDTFDAMGYAVAEEIDGEFWTSDRRFANAASGARLARVRFIA
jgi:predicted nucleic acid-binding protein